MGDALDHLGPGDEHLAGVHHHKVKSVRAGEYSAARTGAHRHRDLWHDTRGEGVPHKDVAIAAEGPDALLHAGAARVVDADQRGAGLEGQILDLADLGRVRLAEAAAQHGKVLRKDIDQPAGDGTIAGYHAIAGEVAPGHAEIGGVVGDELVDLLEAALVEQQGQPLASRLFALVVLPVDGLLAAPLLDLFLQVAQPADLVRGALRSHCSSYDWYAYCDVLLSQISSCTEASSSMSREKSSG